MYHEVGRELQLPVTSQGSQLLLGNTLGQLDAARLTPPPAPITVDHPARDSIFPTEFPAPMFLRRDLSPAVAWIVDAAVRSTLAEWGSVASKAPDSDPSGAVSR